VLGNCYERNYTPEMVADHLRKVLTVAPSLVVRVHCGAPYEDEECVATVIAGEGEAKVLGPMVGTVPEIPMEQLEAALVREMSR